MYFFFWTDFFWTVLKHMKNGSKRFSLRDPPRYWNSNKNEWHYIPSKFNVADDCTRPTKFEEFHNNYSYLNGPKFLIGPELPIFICSEDSFLTNLHSINFETKYLKKMKFVKKKSFPALIFGNDFQIGINSLELQL